MGVELKDKKTPNICVNDMLDGQIAEILQWGEDRTPIGRIVQRVDGVLFVIGEGFGKSYSMIFKSRQENCRVRPLEPGEHIVVKSN